MGSLRSMDNPLPHMTQVLFYLYPDKTSWAYEISKHLKLNLNSVYTAIRKLERNEWVESELEPTPPGEVALSPRERRRFCRLTPDGVEYVEHLLETIERLVNCEIVEVD